MNQPTHFIEVVKLDTGDTKSFSIYPLKDLKYILNLSRKFGFQTIAIFKIYPK